MADEFSGAGGIYPAGSFYQGIANRLSTLEQTVGTSLGAVTAAEQAQAAATAANTAATNAQTALDTVIANTADIAATAAAAAEAEVAAAAAAALASAQASADAAAADVSATAADALADAQAAALAAEAAANAAGNFDPDGYVQKTGTLLTGGFTATSKDIPSPGTDLSVSPDGGNIQNVVNAGALTINAPTAAGVYTIILEIVNTATAGAVTFSGFSLVDGDNLTTTSGHAFHVYVTKTSNHVSATVKALQ